VIGKLHNRLVFRRRAEVLAGHLSGMIPKGARLLDVGCGDGTVARLLLEKRPDTSIHGIDVLLRPDLHIPVTQFDGTQIPHPDKSFDAVIFVDVLHHADDPIALLKEASRVARQCIVIKDHNCDSRTAELTLAFMDWVGNAPHGVALTYDYWSEKRWRTVFAEMGLRIADYRGQLQLYPIPASWLFERNMHFMSRLDV
jgi:ubiquinone/menaquinone biosynthesis C-methylase UbiE